MRKTILFFVLFICSVSAQPYRYTSTQFPNLTSQDNITFATVPFIDGPLHTVETSTTEQEIKMDIFYPANDAVQLRPALIFVHGGGFITGNKNHDDMMAFCDSLAQKGYVTATIDYRQGFNFLVGNIELHSQRAVYRGIQDGRSAVRFLRANAANYGIDADKIYMIGSSAGALVGLHAVYMDQPNEVPSNCGLTPYTNATFPFSHVAPNLGPKDIGNHLEFNGTPNAVISLWGALNDTSLISNTDETPVFLVHGEADTTVPFVEGSPFGYPLLPSVKGSSLIKDKYDDLEFEDYETYFVPNQPHEFYGVDNGTWENGTNGNTYWPIVLNKTVDFLWKLHKPNADFTFNNDTNSIVFTSNSTSATSWLWDFGDGTFSDLENPIHTYINPGIYNVKLYIENDIKSWDETNQDVDVVILNSNQFNLNNLTISPNPFTDSVYIKGIESDAFVRLYNVSGALILEKSIRSVDSNINLEDLASGVYFLKCTSLNSSKTFKLIKSVN